MPCPSLSSPTLWIDKSSVSPPYSTYLSILSSTQHPSPPSNLSLPTLGSYRTHMSLHIYSAHLGSPLQLPTSCMPMHPAPTLATPFATPQPVCMQDRVLRRVCLSVGSYAHMAS
jgi:hypothetical protein